MKCEIEMLTRGLDYARFSRVYFSEPFNRELVTAIDLKERTIRERTELPDGKLRLRVYIAPRVDLPAVIEKIVKGYTIGYEETTLYDPATGRAQSSVQTPGGDLLHVDAETHFTAVLEGVRTHIEMQVKVKLFGVGGLVERFVCSETQKRYRLVEAALQRYIDENKDQ
jgi:hypothetical protein